MYNFLQEEINQFEKIYDDLYFNPTPQYTIQPILQPILKKDTINGLHVFGYESLFRVHHYKHGILPLSIPFYIYSEQFPDKYLFLTKKNLITVFNKIKVVKPTNKVFINISLSRDILNDSIFSLLIELLQENKENNKRIVLEILENDKILMSQAGLKKGIKRIEQIRNKFDINIALDDYGTGNSNFDKLLYIEPDFVKIDGYFIKNITKDEKIKKIVEHLFLVCSMHNMSAIAEFVENEKIFQTVQNIGFKYFQGFFFHGRLAPVLFV